VRPILVADYLRAGGTYASLIADHAVHAKPYNGKVSFVYDQLAARDEDALACQCRGLVLRETTWEVVAYPFDRFFNHGQGAAASIDWSTAAFEEKLDGTLLIVYSDGGRWRCATRSMCEAHGNINGVGTFAELADECARQMGVGAVDLHTLMDGVGADPCITYLFELTGPYNRIVCEYRELGLTLLGMRRLSDFAELDPKTAGDYLGFRSPKTWRFSSIDELVEVIRDWHPLEFEGVIVKDAAFNRIKVKSPSYLAVAHASESLGASWRAVCEAIIGGHADDISAAVTPLVRSRIDSLRPAVAQVVAVVESDFAELKGIDDMKTYALAAQKKLWSAPLFALKRGKSESVAAFLADANPDNVLELCRKVGWTEPDLSVAMPRKEPPP